RERIHNLQRVHTRAALLVNYGSRILTTGEQKSCDGGWNLRCDFRDQVFGNWPRATRHGGNEPEGRGAMANRHPGLLATLDATDLDAGCGYGTHEVLCQKSSNHSAIENRPTALTKAVVGLRRPPREQC